VLTGLPRSASLVKSSSFKIINSKAAARAQEL
jgi:hypothetical protein